VKCACDKLSSVASPALLYFSTLFDTRHDFQRKLPNIKYFDFPYSFFSETLLILNGIERDVIKYVHRT
jgi:hypothetical protein